MQKAPETIRERLLSGLAPPLASSVPALWFIFRNHELLVKEEGQRCSLPALASPDAAGLQPLRQRYLGTLRGRPCYAAEVPPAAVPAAGLVFRGLRFIYQRLEASLHYAALKAVHLIEWDGNTGYCSRCGAETREATGMTAKECTRCGFLTFPRISPAIIVAITRGERLLLAHSPRFAGNIYSVLAGFVEPGESLEEALHREIAEEVGIRVKNVSYFGSQPWPFPDSLMVGFTAEYDEGELVLDATEITSADWFDAEHLPEIPDGFTIARRLIDWFLETHAAGQGEPPLPLAFLSTAVSKS